MQNSDGSIGAGPEYDGPKPTAVFFAGGDPQDIREWSGTPFFMLEAARTQFDIVYVERRPFVKGFAFLRKVVFKLTRGRVDLRMMPAAVRAASWASRKRLNAQEADVFISVAASGVASMLAKGKRQVLISDATSIALSGYYNRLDQLWPSVRQNYIAMEASAMRQASILSYPSRWAAESAMVDFGIAAQQIAIIPWGPNMEKPSAAAPRSIDDGVLRLIFIGVDWQRKGGAIALATMRHLQAAGVSCHLDIVGIGEAEADGPIPENVTFHGLLSKGDPEQGELFNALFERANLLFLPTKAEALGMVFAEAAALGIPSVSFATGGVSTVVKHGETGILCDESAGAEQFASEIRALANDAHAYRRLSEAALNDSRERLDWNVWAVRLREVVERAK